MSVTLTISSKNYSSWSLRGWLLCKFAGISFQENILSSNDASARAELLLLSPSFLVPCLHYEGITVWDTLAIAEFLAELRPEAGLLPKDPADRALCRSISGEMHGGFANLRSALPMNLKGDFPGFPVWPGARADVDRIVTIWHDCFARHPEGPFLFGPRGLADAMYAPVVTRFLTYHVEVDEACAAYCKRVAAMPEMREWSEEALREPSDVEELEAEF
jgi:glutathione S-transferase